MDLQGGMVSEQMDVDWLVDWVVSEQMDVDWLVDWVVAVQGLRTLDLQGQV